MEDIQCTVKDLTLRYLKYPKQPTDLTDSQSKTSISFFTIEKNSS